MKKDTLTTLFKELEGRFDTEEPHADHRDRFLEKLQQVEKPVQTKTSNWRKLLAVAASIVLVVMVMLTRNSSPELKELADVSPEMEKTQDFFTSTINRELFQIQEKATPENQELIDDAIIRLGQLEEAYESLKNDLVNSGEDKRVIYAMIENFQNRIDLLQQVLAQIDAIQTLHTLQPTAL